MMHCILISNVNVLQCKGMCFVYNFIVDKLKHVFEKQRVNYWKQYTLINITICSTLYINATE